MYVVVDICTEWEEDEVGCGEGFVVLWGKAGLTGVESVVCNIVFVVRGEDVNVEMRWDEEERDVEREGDVEKGVDVEVEESEVGRTVVVNSGGNIVVLSMNWRNSAIFV